MRRRFLAVATCRANTTAYDPFVALTAAAAATLAVGTGVLLLAQRDAIQTAKEVASIDHISGGRFLLGLGLGWNLEEAADHGVQSQQRGKLLDEKLAAMKALWSDDKPEFRGENVDFDSAFSWPKPVQRPYPPIYFGGYPPITVARARRHQAGWMPIGAPTPDLVPVQIMLDGATDIPVIVVLLGAVGPELLDACRNQGVERATITLPSKPEPETLLLLDDLAVLVDYHR